MIANDPLVAAFRGLEAPGVSDALDKLGIKGQCRGIMSLDPRAGTVIGRAYTVRIQPVSTPPVGTLGDYLDEVAPGDIVMIDNGGRTEFSVWGDIITRFAMARNFGGTVIDGVCRDAAAILDAGYPMFSCGRFPQSGKGRLQVGAMAETVTIGGVRVEPGDLVIADASGVVSVPKAHATKVADIAHDLARVESEMSSQIDSGKSMKDVWAYLATLKKT